MATHNFQIFDESMTDTMTDIDYQTDTQRTNGVIPGVADPLLHNKLYRQCSVMAYAIAQTIVARGYNASDSDPVALVNAIQRTFAFSVNGNVPNASGAVTAVRPIDAWPVGSLFMTFSSTNPSTLLGGGTWTQIKGKYIIAADTGYTVDGSTTYGAMTKNVPLVAHTHTFTTAAGGAHSHTITGTAASNGNHTHSITTSSDGSHTHTASTGSTGNHSHTRGSMNITGTFSGVGNLNDNTKATLTGAFYRINTVAHPAEGAVVGNDGSARDDYFGFNAARDNGKYWTGSTSTTGAHTHTVTVNSNGAHKHGGTAASNGAHTHTVSGSTNTSTTHTHTGTTASAGTSASFDVRPLSLAVYMWRRTA